MKNEQIIRDTAEFNYKKGYKTAKQDILNFIETQRDNGNCEPIDIQTNKRGFSAGICLSDLIKYLDKK